MTAGDHESHMNPPFGQTPFHSLRRAQSAATIYLRCLTTVAIASARQGIQLVRFAAKNELVNSILKLGQVTASHQFLINPERIPAHRLQGERFTHRQRPLTSTKNRPRGFQQTTTVTKRHTPYRK